MKKTLLIIFVALFTLGINAQKVWNFSVAPFGVNAIAGGSAAINFSTNYVYDGLTMGTDGSALFALTANNKTFDGVAYSYRLQTGGGGAPLAPSKIPNTRYLKFNVSGASAITIGMMSSSSSATRTLIIVNSDETVIDSIVNISGTAATTYTYNYSGAASTIYLYSRASGINYYFVTATNVLSGISNVLTNKGISFDGRQIANNNNLSLEVYNVLGKMVASSTGTINTDNFAKGVYVARSKGVEGVLKFSK